MTRRPAQRLAMLLVAAAPLIASCELDNQTIGPAAGAPAGGAQFQTYTAIGTSLSAGVQSDGLNDSTQRSSFVYQLAVAMGHTPGTTWFYPAMNFPGCPSPIVNPLTGLRVGGAPAPPAAGSCRARATSSIRETVNNLGIPRMRAAQALDVVTSNFPTTDVEFGPAAQFITGSIAPMDHLVEQQPTFVTLEVGANDVLLAATRGDASLITPIAAFQAALTTIATRLTTEVSPAPNVAISNIPNVTQIPHFTRASVLFCLNTGACPGVPATLPYSSPLFTVDASCAPNLAGGVGDSYLLTLGATSQITGVLAASRAAKIDCGRDSALVAVAAAPAPATATAGATINVTEFATFATRVTEINAAIAAAATANNWALVDLNAGFTAQAANIPAIPSYTTPLTLFLCPSAGCPTGTATIFSQDGVHPSTAGYRLMAQLFAAAINAKYGSALAIP